MKRTFGIRLVENGGVVLMLRKRDIYLEFSAENFVKSIADMGIEEAKTLTVSTTPLENSTLLEKTGIERTGAFRVWSTGLDGDKVRLCVKDMSRLFPRARKLWVVVK